jgi:hypothetical protein
MAFFVELPADVLGNRAYTNSFPCVVEGKVIGRELIVKAPPEIAKRWSTIIFNHYGGWLEVEGPARPLTWEEREELIRLSRTAGNGD